MTNIHRQQADGDRIRELERENRRIRKVALHLAIGVAGLSQHIDDVVITEAVGEMLEAARKALGEKR